MTEQIKFLTDYQHGRHRVEMYLGSKVPTEINFPIFNDIDRLLEMEKILVTPAAFTAFREALDNHLDELTFVGKGDISVWYSEATGIIKTEDNGRGIPLDRDENGNYIATRVVSETKAGRNFGERGEQAGTNGLGISVVNFCSEFFNLSVKRDKTEFVQEFREGEEALDISLPFVTPSPKQRTTGTKVEFKLSEKVFGEIVLPSKLIESYVHFVAYTNPHLTFRFNGESIASSKDVAKNIFGKSHLYEFKFEDERVRGSYFLKKSYSEETDPSFFSLVNNVPAYNGGPHDDEIRFHFPRQLLKALERESKRRKLSPNKNDVLENLMFIGVIKMKAPNFDSQSKTRLTNPEVKKPIFLGLTQNTDWNDFIKKNRDLVEDIYARCAARTGKTDKSTIDQNEKQLKKLKIPALLDANSKNRKECILFITEGDSAKGGLNDARNPSIHALMPLRGKIRNVHSLKPAEALKSKIIEQLSAAIGLVPGKKAKLEDLRYGKIYIMADADEDGQGSICPLVVNLFHHFWPELFDLEEPFVNIFITPLIIISKGKERKYFYPLGEPFEPSKYRGWSVTRAKGLGSLETENFRDHLEDIPAIGLTKDDSIEHVLHLLFNGARADDRKLFMELTVDECMEKISDMGSDWQNNTLDII
ncbi:DNA topoisomerase large subunit [Agrobacterium phage Atu_ph04]|uniref:DNA topoisomerase 2 n=1 Tax=Agrobacterium phage Atu_ph04 TaxID=2024263 RepID=A0A223VZQ6_9CAUD|nr:DNA topoisomerase large subunit [Agrobacterium phage Atu_ph04]ASV44653.1 DNA topoisomerase large subunit [Agrobacterium phage Atu_ph04]